MSNEFGMKELYSVLIKTTYPMRINGKDFEEGEVIAAFDKIQLANFQENSRTVAASGGFDNRAHVTWKTTKEVDLIFSQGVFSKEQFALLTGANLTRKGDSIEISQREKVETNEEGKFELKEIPTSSFFLYDMNGNKIPLSNYTRNGREVIVENSSYQELICDYNFIYNSNVSKLVIGQELVRGYISLEGRTRVKDDITGHTHTGIIKIPRLKLMSDLSMRLGENSSPMLSTFKAIGCPVGSRGDSYVMDILFLDDDIDSDF